MSAGILIATIAAILLIPKLEELSQSSSDSQSVPLPPRNILQSQSITIANFDINTLDLIYQDARLPICDVAQDFRDLNLRVSQSRREIESLRDYLGILLYSIKIATKKEECSYFSQLRLDITQIWNRIFAIQDSLNATLALNSKALSSLSTSHSIIE